MSYLLKEVFIALIGSDNVDACIKLSGKLDSQTKQCTKQAMDI